jgi:mRNA interferase MazF
MKLLLDMKQDLRSVNSVVIKRGDILYADLSPVIGSEQGGIRPVLVIQNDIGNKYSPTIIVAAITSQINKAKLPTHIEINAEEYGITKDSVILLEQIRTIDKKRLKEKVGHLSDDLMKKVDDGLQISFGLIEYSV